MFNFLDGRQPHPLEISTKKYEIWYFCPQAARWLNIGVLDRWQLWYLCSLSLEMDRPFWVKDLETRKEYRTTSEILNLF